MKIFKKENESEPFCSARFQTGLKGSKECINDTASFIAHMKNRKITPIDSTIENSEIICCDELSLGIF